MSENELVSFGRLVAGEAGFVQCLVARLSVLKVTEPPTTRCGVLFCGLITDVAARSVCANFSLMYFRIGKFM
jgi:hypothetical protein